MGLRPALITFICDFLKGALPVFITIQLFPEKQIYIILVAISCILGHTFSIFLKFKGGKGVATGSGVLFVIMPKIFIIAVIVFAIVVFVSKLVSLGSITSALTVVVLVWLFSKKIYLNIFFTVICYIIIYKHIPNIKRIIQGKELKI